PAGSLLGALPGLADAVVGVCLQSARLRGSHSDSSLAAASMHVCPRQPRTGPAALGGLGSRPHALLLAFHAPGILRPSRTARTRDPHRRMARSGLPRPMVARDSRHKENPP